MKTRAAIIAGSLVVGALGGFASTLVAQQGVKAPSVITPHGFIVEEVRVGQSCVVIVFRGGSAGPTDSMSAIPCTP